MLHCNHRLLEPFLPKGIQIPKLSRCSMELAVYNITFLHIKGKHNILADTISRLKSLNIYEEALENPKAQLLSNSLLFCYRNMCH